MSDRAVVKLLRYCGFEACTQVHDGPAIDLVRPEAVDGRDLMRLRIGAMTAVAMIAENFSW